MEGTNLRTIQSSIQAHCALIKNKGQSFSRELHSVATCIFTLLGNTFKHCCRRIKNVFTPIKKEVKVEQTKESKEIKQLKEVAKQLENELAVVSKEQPKEVSKEQSKVVVKDLPKEIPQVPQIVIPPVVKKNSMMVNPVVLESQKKDLKEAIATLQGLVKDVEESKKKEIPQIKIPVIEKTSMMVNPVVLESQKNQMKEAIEVFHKISKDIESPKSPVEDKKSENVIDIPGPTDENEEVEETTEAQSSEGWYEWSVKNAGNAASTVGNAAAVAVVNTVGTFASYFFSNDF
jgi:hypothetical protein